MHEPTERQRIVAFRTTEDFVRAFDPICSRLGCSRSDLIRYVLDRWTRSIMKEPRLLGSLDTNDA